MIHSFFMQITAHYNMLARKNPDSVGTNGPAKPEERTAIRAKFSFPNGLTDEKTISVNGKPFRVEFDKVNSTASFTEMAGKREDRGETGNRADTPAMRIIPKGVALATEFGKIVVTENDVTFVPKNGDDSKTLLPSLRIDNEKETVNCHAGTWEPYDRYDENALLSLIALSNALATGMEGADKAVKGILAAIAGFVDGYIQSYYPDQNAAQDLP